MNNYELYRTLSKQIGITGTVYFKDAIGTYGRTREVYVPAHIMELKLDDTTDMIKVKLALDRAFGSCYAQPIDNVSVADIFLPSPLSSRSHGNMIPVRTYFEIYGREMLEKQSIERLSFGFYKKDTKFDYDKIIFSGPCTIIIWKDGTKTMTRVSEGDTFDPEKGVAICFMKRILGHTNTNKILRKELEQYWDEQKACAKEYIKEFHNCFVKEECNDKDN